MKDDKIPIDEERAVGDAGEAFDHDGANSPLGVLVAIVFPKTGLTSN